MCAIIESHKNEVRSGFHFLLLDFDFVLSKLIKLAKAYPNLG